MKIQIKFYLLLLAVLLTIQVSCLDDDTSSEKGSGTLKVTVNTGTDIWGYPLFDEFLSVEDPLYPLYLAFSGNSDGLWHYPEVGGDGSESGEKSLYDDKILSTDCGDKKNIVYLYSQLGDDSQSYPVLYRGEAETNGESIIINDIVAGTYYVVAFYNYKSGGKVTNLLNRYDRYSFYTDTTPLDSTNSTPYSDNAATVEITENGTVEITLEIKKDWVLGKPYESTGRYFLKFSEGIPVP